MLLGLSQSSLFWRLLSSLHGVWSDSLSRRRAAAGRVLMSSLIVLAEVWLIGLKLGRVVLERAVR